MDRSRLATILAVALAVLYVALGIAETVRAVRSGDGGVAFWFGTLVGGGALILVGLTQRRRHALRAAVLVTVGALAGVLATLWTLIVPALAVTVVALTLLSTAPAAPPDRDVGD